MKAVMLSKTLVEAYKSINLEISYALSELLGCVDYDFSSRISILPVIQRDTVEFPIEDAVYNELQDKFDALESHGEVAELLLWSNYFTGGRL